MVTADLWSVTNLPSFKSRSAEEIDVLWSADLPSYRDENPGLWDAMIGFFEDAIVSSCSRPGKLVVTPRELLKQLKHNGREPSSGLRIMRQLFQKGDIVSADTLKPPSKESTARSGYTLSSLKQTIGSYIWSSKKPEAPDLDDPIVPVAALKAAAARLSSYSDGPMASTEIHTVKSLASAVTERNTRDAEAIISYLVSKNEAVPLFTEPSPEHPEPVLGVKFGKQKVNPSDKGVLRTKAALEHMEQQSSHLEKAIAKEIEAATRAAKTGNKAEALTRLRKKKVLEAKLTGARSAAAKLSDVLLAVDEAESNKEAVLALETGMESLKLVNENGVTADRVDNVAADFKELMEDQSDVRLALEQLGQESAADDAVLEEELELLVSGRKPSEIEVNKQPTKTLADEAEEELAQLLAKLPSPSAEAVPDPYKAAASSSAAGEAQKYQSDRVEANIPES
eukprot:TRINITY_DN423_c0_g1_i1.p1 TRINITY_DN423_c0_g1~~TRINITY_DN423_c0_g1_i1.p1  ORF type:complete len:453 (-),score=101.15 TRINITY_DN423_c0_g1_i1:6980-8338(-)